MKVSILCSVEHPILKYIEKWADGLDEMYEVQHHHDSKTLIGGDLLFLISCSEFIKKEKRCLYKKVLVIHASDLPGGRGWSPHIWQALENCKEITVSLL